MPEPRSGSVWADPEREIENDNAPSQIIARSPSGRLHLGLLIALAAVGLIAAAFPAARFHVHAKEANNAPVVVVSGGLASTLQIQAQTVVQALAGADPVATPQAINNASAQEAFPAVGLVPRPVLLTAAHVFVRGALAGPNGQQRLAMQIQKPVQFTLHNDGFSSAVFSTRPTIGGALNALGVEYSRYDRVFPSPDTPLTPGMHVFVKPAINVSLSVGGRSPSRVYTHADTVGDLLAERDIELLASDSVNPGPATPLKKGMTVAVTIVRAATEYEDTIIPFRITYRDDPNLNQGSSRLVAEGENGLMRLEYEVVYRNGNEIGRKLVSESIVPPTHRVIAVGTAAPAPAAAAPAPAGGSDCAQTMHVWATWYTAASAGGSGITRTGTTVRKGTVAVDPRVIPLGTRMYIPGYGYGVAEDTGGGIIGHKIDLGYGPNDPKDWRTGWVTICILN